MNAPIKSSTRQHIRGSSLLFAGRFISIALKFVLLIFIVRYLSKAEYGAFAYVLNLVEIAAIIAAMGLEKAASRYVSFYDERGDYASLWGFVVLSIGMVLAIGIAMTLLVLGFEGVIAGSLVQDPLIVSLMMIMIALAPMRAFDSWCEAVCAAFSYVRAIFFRRYLLVPGLQILCILYVIWRSEDVYTLAWCYLLAGGIATATYLVILYQMFQRRGLLGHFSLSTLRFNAGEIFGFSAPTLLSGIAFILRGQIVVIFLEWYGTTESVAEYRAVLPLAALNLMVYSSFAFLYMPLVARMLAKSERSGVNDLYWRTADWTTVATLPVFLVTFVLAQPLVVLLFGERYASSGVILSVLALGQFFQAMIGFNVYTLRVYGAVRYVLLVDLVAMAFALTAFWFLIPLYGALGGAIGYSLSIVLWKLLNQIGLTLHSDVRILDRAHLQTVMLVCAITLFLAGLQYAFSPSLIISLPIAALLSLGLLYLTRRRLQVDQVFPELLKVPLLGRILRD